MTVYREMAPTVNEFFSLGEIERVDQFVLGDSQSYFADSNNGGFGYYKGFAYAHNDRTGLYRSPTLPANVDPGNFQSLWDNTNIEEGLVPGGSLRRYTDVSGSDTNSDAPAELDQYAAAPTFGVAAAAGAVPRGYYFLSDASQLNAPNQANGPVWWNPNNPAREGLLDISANLTYRMRYGTFETGSGSFALQCLDWRATLPNFTGVSHANGSVINPVTGAFGLEDATLPIPAAERGVDGITIRPIQITAGSGGGTRVDMRGPFFGLWQTLVNDDKQNGFGVTLAGHFGGQTARHAADYYAGTDGSIAAGFNPVVAQQEFFRFSLAAQRPDIANAKVIVSIYFAQNDVAGLSTEPSLGPNPAPSNTAAGFADNHVEIIRILRERFVGIGVNLDNVLFVLGPYHPNPNQSSATRNQFAEELYNTFLDDNRVAVGFGEEVATQSEILANGGFTGSHLMADSYTFFSGRSIDIADAEAVAIADPLPTPEVITPAATAREIAIEVQQLSGVGATVVSVAGSEITVTPDSPIAEPVQLVRRVIRMEAEGVLPQLTRHASIGSDGNVTLFLQHPLATAAPGSRIVIGEAYPRN